jgi:hypothetical protein
MSPTEEQNDRFDAVLDRLDDRFVARVLGLGGYGADYEAIIVRFDSFSQARAERILRALEGEARRIQGLW